MSRSVRTLVIGSLLAVSGCAIEPYCLECEEDPVDAGGLDARDGGAEDTGGLDVPAPDVPLDTPILPDGCAPGAAELCNGFDDDCDGRADEGIDTSTDEANCGGCGNACAPPNAFGECVAGECTVRDCDVTYFDRDMSAVNGCEVRCVPTGDEVCNRRDDDCDFAVDETFDLATDPMNCGNCGRICRAPRASATCVAGACALGACEPGFIDLDGLEANGCEFGCTPTGDELCNLRDDDCDGRTDEGNPEAGGSCGVATGECVEGILNCVGGSLACSGGTSPSTELCNGLDDDCDGEIDENNPEGGRACGSAEGACVPGREVCTAGVLVCSGAVTPTAELCNATDDDCDGVVDDGNPEGGAPCGTDVGECVAGSVVCVGGGLSCSGAVGPALDVCNGLDDDCDGTADQTFNLASDPNNCGACGRRCSFANAIAGCAAGGCTFLACAPGFVNADGNTANGCEYLCTPSGSESCNGEDDDCDTRTDESLVAPVGFCNPNGVCAGTGATCGGSAGWECNYPSSFAASEVGRCDGLDNDCNGVVDDGFNIGVSCTNGEIGACRRTGTIACTSPAASACNAPASGGGTMEVCNNVDDDCDGVLDDGVMGNWVPFTIGGATNYIMAYEASRPDATGMSAGVASHRVCSEPGRLPWTTVTQPAAEAACATLGAVLCSEAQWETACESATSPTAGAECLWSEATTCRTFNTLCNTNEFDSNASLAGDQDALMSTGAMSMCFTPWTIGGVTRSVFDMSGNVQEWTRERAPNVNPMRGGTYLDPQGGTTCQLNFEVASDTIALPTVGFRCCRTTAP